MGGSKHVHEPWSDPRTITGRLCSGHREDYVDGLLPSLVLRSLSVTDGVFLEVHLAAEAIDNSKVSGEFMF